MINVARFSFNPFGENTYVVWDATGECIVIDAGNYSAAENAALCDFIGKKELRPVMAVNTHGHIDHILGVQYIKDTYGVPFAVSSGDGFLLDNARNQASLYGFDIDSAPAAEIDLDKLDAIEFGESRLEIIRTPGHSPGHLCFHNSEQGIVFTGDTLFRESIGRTDLPGGDYSWIMRSILDNILPLGDRTIVYPGHGGDTTIGHEAMYNPFIVEVLQGEVKP